MEKQLSVPFKKGYEQGRFATLLLAILCYLFIAPFLKAFPGLNILLNIFMTGVLIAGIYSVSQRKKVTIFAALLAMPVFASIWTRQITGAAILTPIGDSFGIMFMSYLAVLILSSVIRARKVSHDVIYGAIVVYLIIGITWGFVFRVIETLEPGSFSLAVESLQQDPSLLYYFSFVTLTTLGYGDITPLSTTARSFAYLEALIGQIYLTVLVARLVGLHISQSLEKK